MSILLNFLYYDYHKILQQQAVRAILCCKGNVDVYLLALVFNYTQGLNKHRVNFEDESRQDRKYKSQYPHTEQTAKSKFVSGKQFRSNRRKQKENSAIWICTEDENWVVNNGYVPFSFFQHL